MKYVPKSVQRFGHMNLLKLQKNSPTLLVIGGVIGLGATAVMAAIATRKIDPILDDHKKARLAIDEQTSYMETRDEQQEIVKLYAHTGFELVRVYTPTILVGTLSIGSVLYGHKILKGRHLATVAAYSGLMEQYQAYRARVAETVGVDMEREIHQGAVGKWEEDPEHPGELKLKAHKVDAPATYLRPFFDESNPNWTRDATSNYLFLKGIQNHMNRILEIRGYVFLFDVYDALGIPRTPETIVTGWVYGSENGDGFVDFGFMTSTDPQTIMFRNGGERSVRLNFNIDGVIWDQI